MKQNIIILSAVPYSIPDEKTGRVNEGVSITYLTSEDLSPVRNDNGSYGVKPAKGSLSKSLQSSIVSAPAYYAADLDIAIGSDGRPALKIKSVTYSGDISASVKKWSA